MISVYPDADGDGRPATLDQPRMICEGESLAGFTTVGTPPERDCDDADPQLWQALCTDLDGDGAVSEVCVGDDPGPDLYRCPYVLEWTPDPGPYDCDDTDPTLIDYFYEDQDGDGFGAGDPICFRNADGFSAWHGDCADDDASRAPLALEVFGDGVDGDCDGDDGASCGAGTPLREFDWPDAPSPDAACDGPNLALAVLSCASCYTARSTFAVENRGAARFEGQVTLSGIDMSLPLSLDPGQRQLLLSWPDYGDFVLGVDAAGVADCNPADNSAHTSHGHCI